MRLLRFACASGALLLAGCLGPAASPEASGDRTEITPETPEARDAVQASLDALLAAMREGPTARTLAPYLVARGGAADREWRVAADPQRERAWVESVLRELARLPLGAGYRIDEFVVEMESEGEWHVLIVEFDDPERTEAEFAFLPIGDRFLLGDL